MNKNNRHSASADVKNDVIQSSVKLFHSIKTKWDQNGHLEAHEIDWLLSMTELYFKSKK